MIKFAFKLVSFFWIVSPIMFAVGWYHGIWDFQYDLFVFFGLSLMSTIALFLNYDPQT